MAETRLTVRREFPRPADDVLAGFRGVPTGWAVDAQGRRGAPDPGIRRLVGSGRISGPALTVRSAARDNLAPYAALRFARPGDILVIATGDWQGGSVVGDILAGMAKNAGIAAIVTDGLVRDIEGLRAVGLPVFARGLSPNSPAKSGPGSVGLPIALGGEAVDAGDIVIADEDGVVIVPQAHAAAVLAALDGVRAKEAQMEAAVEDGAREPGWLDAVLRAEDVAFLD
jgi:4-hydroxy-4-methyl-2-oxoglutarate aldolase